VGKKRRQDRETGKQGRQGPLTFGVFAGGIGYRRGQKGKESVGLSKVHESEWRGGSEEEEKGRVL